MMRPIEKNKNNNKRKAPFSISRRREEVPISNNGPSAWITQVPTLEEKMDVDEMQLDSAFHQDEINEIRVVQKRKCEVLLEEDMERASVLKQNASPKFHLNQQWPNAQSNESLCRNRFMLNGTRTDMNHHAPVLNQARCFNLLLGEGQFDSRLNQDERNEILQEEDMEESAAQTQITNLNFQVNHQWSNAQSNESLYQNRFSSIQTGTNMNHKALVLNQAYVPNHVLDERQVDGRLHPGETNEDPVTRKRKLEILQGESQEESLSESQNARINSHANHQWPEAQSYESLYQNRFSSVQTGTNMNHKALVLNQAYVPNHVLDEGQIDGRLHQGETNEVSVTRKRKLEILQGESQEESLPEPQNARMNSHANHQWPEAQSSESLYQNRFSSNKTGINMNQKALVLNQAYVPNNVLNERQVDCKLHQDETDNGPVTEKRKLKILQGEGQEESLPQSQNSSPDFQVNCQCPEAQSKEFLRQNFFAPNEIRTYINPQTPVMNQDQYFNPSLDNGQLDSELYQDEINQSRIARKRKWNILQEDDMEEVAARTQNASPNFHVNHQCQEARCNESLYQNKLTSNEIRTDMNQQALLLNQAHNFNNFLDEGLHDCKLHQDEISGDPESKKRKLEVLQEEVLSQDASPNFQVNYQYPKAQSNETLRQKCLASDETRAHMNQQTLVLNQAHNFNNFLDEGQHACKLHQDEISGDPAAKKRKLEVLQEEALSQSQDASSNFQVNYQYPKAQSNESLRQKCLASNETRTHMNQKTLVLNQAHNFNHFLDEEQLHCRLHQDEINEGSITKKNKLEVLQGESQEESLAQSQNSCPSFQVTNQRSKAENESLYQYCLPPNETRIDMNQQAPALNQTHICNDILEVKSNNACLVDESLLQRTRLESKAKYKFSKTQQCLVTSNQSVYHPFKLEHNHTFSNPINSTACKYLGSDKPEHTTEYYSVTSRIADSEFIFENRTIIRSAQTVVHQMSTVQIRGQFASGQPNWSSTNQYQMGMNQQISVNTNARLRNQVQPREQNALQNLSAAFSGDDAFMEWSE